MKTLVKSLALAAAFVACSAQAGPFLLSGSEHEADNDNKSYLEAGGHSATVVAHNNLGTTSFAGYQGVWLSWLTSYDGASFMPSLLSYVQGGGNLLVEGAFTGLEPFLPDASDITVGDGGGDGVHIVGNTNGINTGLTDTVLSNWGDSFHALYTITGSNWTCVSVVASMPSICLTATRSYGLGHITLTAQDISYHISRGAGDTGTESSKYVFALNALTIDSAVAEVPEPASIALLGLGLIGLAASRKRKQG